MSVHPVKNEDSEDPTKSEDVPMMSSSNTTAAADTESNGDQTPATVAAVAPAVAPAPAPAAPAPAAPASTSVKKKLLLLGDDAEAEEEEDEDVDMGDETTETKTTEPSPELTQTQLQDPNNNLQSTAAASQQQYIIPSTIHNQLLSQIITPSPFQHHNDSATSDRYRSALQRITISPLHDVEAWEAIMTECMSLYRTQLLPRMEEEKKNWKIMMNGGYGNSASAGFSSTGPRINVDLEQKLDWVESCHGHLLHYFPYTASYYVSILEVLLARSSLFFESYTGGEEDFSFMTSNGSLNLDMNHVQQVANDKANRIFEFILGVKMDGSSVVADSSDSGTATAATINTASMDVDNQEKENSTSTTTAVSNSSSPTSISESQALLGGMCTSSVELWQLFIRKRSRDAKREALRNHTEAQTQPTIQQQQQPTRITQKGEDLIRDWIIGAYETALSNGAAFVHNNDVIWKAYLSYIKSWNVMMTAASPTNPEVTINHMLHSKQKELLRSIYQRIVQLPMTGLDSLWTEYEVYEKAQSEQLATALIGEFMPKYQHARSVYLERNRVFNIHELRMGKVATPPADYESNSTSTTTSGSTKEETKAKIIEEMKLLSKWKRRCAYERTNPERLSNADLAIRVRQCFKDTICAFMRHIEVWHEWSMWELHTSAGGASSSSAAASAVASSSTNGKKRSIQYATSVLNLAQKHVPDCTLLAYANAQILENQVDGSNECADEAIDVMRTFCNRAGNTLGYILLQRLVRKYKGVAEARKIFAIARRELRIRPEDRNDRKSAKSTLENAASSNVNDTTKATGDAGVVDATNQTAAEETSKKLVMTRESFGNKDANTTSLKSNPLSDGSSKNKNGFVTWHLYAHHASIEHRINQLPKVAAKVFELGLRKHRSFLATPQYVLQYCLLLFELGDEENLRALLTRAIAACEEDSEEDGDGVIGTSNASKSATRLGKREKQRPLWDMMLRFESIVSARSGDHTTLREIEAKRRNALFGPEGEDVSGGNFLDENDVGIGMQKISLSDTLIRSDGYDISSKIINGLGRMVDTLEISGILSDDSRAQLFGLGVVWKDDGAGGSSDASFRRRKRLQTERSILGELSASGSEFFRNAPFGAGITGTSTGKLLSAKERLAQSAFQNPNPSVAATVLSSPEWLRGLLLLLPATTRNYRGAKAPPHMIEMALAALRDNALPSARPSGSLATESTSVKRKRMNDGDSSDEENGNSRVGGYGNQFKARQRAKLMTNSGSS